MTGSGSQGPPRWPVTVLTGMLGSGKTTILRRVLVDPAMRGTAVLINEIGDIGIDHHLIEKIDGEAILMRSGCLCCTLRADLPQTLATLRRRWLGDPALDLQRVVIETTGLAKPGLILRELAVNPLTSGDFPLAAVVTTVDAQHASSQLCNRPEAREQLAVADAVLLTKSDIVEAAQTAAVVRDIAAYNFTASVTTSIPDADISPLFRTDYDHGTQIRAWTNTNEGASLFGKAPASPLLHRHEGIGSLALTSVEPVVWMGLTRFLEALAAELSPRLLRVKGILNVAGSSRPIVVHGVHDAFYPAESLETWPDADHRSRLVLVVDQLNRYRERIIELAVSSGLGWE